MDMRRTAALVAVPTLIIGGSLDPATPPPHSQALSDTIAGARIVLLEAAHLSNVECPDTFAALGGYHLPGCSAPPFSHPNSRAEGSRPPIPAVSSKIV